MFLSGKKLCVVLSVIGTALAAYIDECQFVNEILGRSEGTDCCSMGYPNVLCSKGHITFIDLSGKDIKQLPAMDLPGLTVLNLSNNKISELPDLSKLTSLVSLNLSGNEIKEIPDSVSSLVNLKALDASNNKLTSFQENLVNLKFLTNLDLSNNEIEGKIPSSIGSFDGLKVLKMNNNKLSESIPDDITTLKTLIELDLSSNELTDNIPTDINEIDNLRVLNLSSNKLSGNIPTGSLEKFTNMKEINLEGNDGLYGKAPSITFDEVDTKVVCKYKDTSICYSGKKNKLCEYPSHSCEDCADNAEVDSNDVCVCNSGFSGIGYIDCQAISDSDLNKGSSAADFRTSFQMLTFTTLILLVSYLLM